MKQTFLFIAFLLTFIAFGQKDKPDTNISVISVERANILYRGINNSIKIAVPGAKSFTVTGAGELTKMDSLGNYRYNVNGVSGKRTKLFIDAVMPDNTTKHEEKEFEIWEINQARAYVDGTKKGAHRPYEMTHKELANLNLKIGFDDLYFTLDTVYTKPTSFYIDIDGMETIWLKGNVMTPQVYKFIKQLPAGTILYVNVRLYNPYGIDMAPIPGVKIRIVEEPKHSAVRISTDRNNSILYRSIDNELRIDIDDLHGFKVKAQGLRTEQDSTFFINVTNIKQDTLNLDFEIITKSDSVFHHKELFYIKDIVPKKITINNKSCSDCILEMTLQELKDATINIEEDNNQKPDSFFEVVSYLVNLPNDEIIEVEGDKITDEVFNRLLKLSKKTVFEIIVHNYMFFNPGDAKPLKIKLVKHH